MSKVHDAPTPIAQLIEIMRMLRDPERGCPWDKEQTFETIAPYTIEEAYEVSDAIHRGDLAALKEELGDLLFQVVFHGRMAEEQGAFTFDDIAEAMAEKLIRRHPHVFGDEASRSAAQQTEAWEQIKASERADKGHQSSMDDIPVALPALQRAFKLQKRAARFGFDWNRAESVLEKLTEELSEFSEEVVAGNSQRAREEFGDLLFVLVNLGRHLGVESEQALILTNRKFEQRIRWMEQASDIKEKNLSDMTLEELEALWTEAKLAERSS